MRGRSWLRDCVAWVQFTMVSLEFFTYIIPSGRIMVLGSTQTLTEKSIRSISWGVKAAGA